MAILVNRPVFVLALLITADRKRIVLMKRTRPQWQAGRVNALGGKVLMGESAAAAASREVREESGVEVGEGEWREILVWEDREYRMHVMCAVSARAVEARTMEDQAVFLAEVRALPDEVIDNLRWLVPLALDAEVAMPVRVESAAADGSGLTDRA